MIFFFNWVFFDLIFAFSVLDCLMNLVFHKIEIQRYVLNVIFEVVYFLFEPFLYFGLWNRWRRFWFCQLVLFFLVDFIGKSLAWYFAVTLVHKICKEFRFLINFRQYDRLWRLGFRLEFLNFSIQQSTLIKLFFQIFFNIINLQ